MGKIILAIMFMISGNAFCLAAEPNETSSIDDILEKVETNYSESKSSPSPDQSQSVNINYISEWNKKVAPERLKYEADRYELITRAFEWHHTASVIIFVAVLGIVALALFFSWYEFSRGSGQGQGEHEMELTLPGVSLKIKSSFVGLLILAFSLTFFYLYVKNVYPINVVNTEGKISNKLESE